MERQQVCNSLEHRIVGFVVDELFDSFNNEVEIGRLQTQVFYVQL